MSRREIPVADWEHHQPIWLHNTETELEALMRSAPYEEPEAIIPTVIAARERISDAVEALEPRKRFIIEYTMYGPKTSFRRLGRLMSLSKSQVHRLHQEALKDLAELMA